jgi:hypothetical protein
MNKDCASERDRDSPFRIGDEWDISCSPCGPRRAPHVEDVTVSKATKRGDVGSLAKYILKRATPWKGTIDKLFEGKIQFTRNGAGFISQSRVPAGATGFWLPSYDLHLDHDERNKAGYYPEHSHLHLSYVGLEDTTDVIKKGNWFASPSPVGGSRRMRSPTSKKDAMHNSQVGINGDASE